MNEDQRVPKSVLVGINDIVEGNLATKEELADVLKF